MNENKYKSIINKSKDLITLVNRNYVYEHVNDTYAESFDMEKEELVGARLDEVWGKEVFKDKIKPYLDKCFEGEDIHYIDRFRFGSFLKNMHVSYYPHRESGEEISHAIIFHHDITEIGELETRLNHYEYRDPVTGLYNRRSLEVVLKKELTRAARSESEQMRVLFFIEIPRLEKVVELYGQEIGDILLENTGLRILSELRSSDYIFRLDGNRFAVLLSKVVNDLDAGKVADKIYKTVTFPYDYKGKDIILGCSVGAAVSPHDGESKETLIRHATSAMLEARRRRKSYFLYDKEMHEQAVKQLELESSAYRALEQRDFELNYQPIVDENFRIVGAEALLRWTHPQWGHVSPLELIPVAEQSSLIHAIGKWVLFTVSKFLAAWSRQFGIFISYNISTREFMSPELASNVQNALENAGIHSPRFLKIEVKEPDSLGQIEETIHSVRELSELGVDIYLDDFGSGNSSLRYLKSMPIEVFKIDRCFVEDIQHNSEERDFLEHIIRMIKNRGKKVIVEGVDTKEQAEILQKMGCDRMQGFYFSEPLDAESFVSLLFRGNILPPA